MGLIDFEWPTVDQLAPHGVSEWLATREQLDDTRVSTSFAGLASRELVGKPLQKREERLLAPMCSGTNSCAQAEKHLLH